VLGVNDTSLEKLKLMNGRAHLELSQVTYMLRDQGESGSS